VTGSGRHQIEGRSTLGASRSIASHVAQGAIVAVDPRLDASQAERVQTGQRAWINEGILAYRAVSHVVEEHCNGRLIAVWSLAFVSCLQHDMKTKKSKLKHDGLYIYILICLCMCVCVCVCARACAVRA